MGSEGLDIVSNVQGCLITGFKVLRGDKERVDYTSSKIHSEPRRKDYAMRILGGMLGDSIRCATFVKFEEKNPNFDLIHYLRTYINTIIPS